MVSNPEKITDEKVGAYSLLEQTISQFMMKVKGALLKIRYLLADISHTKSFNCEAKVAFLTWV